MLDHFCLLNDEEGFLGSKTNSWTLLVCFHSLLRLRDRRLKGEGKDIPGAQEPRMLLLPWQLYHNYPRPSFSAPSKTIPDSQRGERETRVTSDEAQGTMERRCERWSRFLLPVFLCPYQPLPGSFPFPPLPFSKWKDLGGDLSAYAGERRFWATHVNRKWGDFRFNIPWLYQMCIAKGLHSYKDNSPENLGVTTVQECKMSTSGWHSSLKNVRFA